MRSPALPLSPRPRQLHSAIDTSRDSRQGTGRRSHRNNKDIAAELTAAQSLRQPSPDPIVAQLPSLHVRAARQPRPPHLAFTATRRRGGRLTHPSHVVAIACRTLPSQTLLPSRSPRRRAVYLTSHTAPPVTRPSATRGPVDPWTPLPHPVRPSPPASTCESAVAWSASSPWPARGLKSIKTSSCRPSRP